MPDAVRTESVWLMTERQGGEGRREMQARPHEGGHGGPSWDSGFRIKCNEKPLEGSEKQDRRGVRFQNIGPLLGEQEWKVGRDTVGSRDGTRWPPRQWG